MSNHATSAPVAPAPDPALFDKIVNLCARRGFVFPSASIYGGIRSAYDYGPVGSEMLRNVQAAWLRAMVQQRDDIVAIEASIIGPPAVWEASGHLANFSDPLVDCRVCKERFRLDKLEDPKVCPACEARDSFTDARQFNLMFKTHAGPIEGAGNEAYLRPETAQGMFINFLNVLNTTRIKPPFGIAQVGKSFRNEITPGNFVFRTREFVQMEMEYFVPPAEAEQWYRYWCAERLAWYIDLGIRPGHLRLRPHTPDELSHYSSGTSDVEYLFPWGFDELEGIANRGAYDLSQHAEHSGQKLEYFDPETRERYVPHVIEPAAGATRTMMAFVIDAYVEEEVRGETRIVLRLDPRLAPYKAAVLPLHRKPEFAGLAKEIAHELRATMMCDYDETASVGKRYRRQDEIGTPFCITVDPDTLTDGHVTVRDRDTMQQVRVPREAIALRLAEMLVGKQAEGRFTPVAA